MPKPKFLYTTTTPFTDGELAELIELARMAMSYHPFRQQIMNDSGATDLHLSLLEQKVHEFQEKMKR